MPRARRTKRFWVIRWKGDQVRKDFFHVLPATRTSKPILDYMIGLYFNSPSLLISEKESIGYIPLSEGMLKARTWERELLSVTIHFLWRTKSKILW